MKLYVVEAVTSRIKQLQTRLARLQHRASSDVARSLLSTFERGERDGKQPGEQAMTHQLLRDGAIEDLRQVLPSLKGLGVRTGQRALSVQVAGLLDSIFYHSGTLATLHENGGRR